MDINKGLKYIAIGFIITLLNINIILNGRSVNITPSFIGWILLFLAHDKLGTYVTDKAYLKWLALIQIIVNGVIWVAGIGMPSLNISIVQSIQSVISLIYTQSLLGTIENIARDYNSDKETTFRILKYIILACELITTLAAFFVNIVTNNNFLLTLMGIVLLFALVAPVVLPVMLVRFAKEIQDKTSE